MIDVLIGAILGLIMFSIGLNLKVPDFQYLFVKPKVLLLGLCLQLIFLPSLAFFVSYLLVLPPAFASGVVILAACPGGLTSNFISYLLRADSALAVSLTICNTSLSLISIPLIVNLGLDVFWSGEGLAQLPFLSTAGRIFLIVLVPVLLGMFFRARRQVQAIFLQNVLRWVSIALLAILFALKLFAPTEAGGSNLTAEEIWIILPASLMINFLALLSGQVFGRLFGFGRNARITLGVEVGIQNTSLAFLITSTLLANEQMLKPALVYAMFTFFTALIYGFWLKPGAWRRLV